MTGPSRELVGKRRAERKPQAGELWDQRGNPPWAGKDLEAQRRMTPFSKKPNIMAEVEIKSWKHKPYTSPASHSDQVL